MTLFFFSSRRRHTICSRDWSSDVCSSDLELEALKPRGGTALYDTCYAAMKKIRASRHSKRALIVITDGEDTNSRYSRSEERRVGKEQSAKAVGELLEDLVVRLPNSEIADQ